MNMNEWTNELIYENLSDQQLYCLQKYGLY